MIVVDTSALIAVIQREARANDCQLVLEREKQVLISAATVTEALIVAARRGFSRDMNQIIASMVTQIIHLTPGRARLASDAYAVWGKNFHRAALNFGDCFSYATAKEFGCPLLFIGNDFASTDVASAIAP
jgi:ribonuclease VapC